MRRSFDLRVRVRRRHHDPHASASQPVFAGFFNEGDGGSLEPSGGHQRQYNLFVRLPRSVAVELQASSTTVAPDEENHDKTSAVSVESGVASSWLGGWFRHGTDHCDALEGDVEFLPLRIEFRGRDGMPVVVYGSYNGGELTATAPIAGGVNTTSGTWLEDRMCDLVD